MANYAGICKRKQQLIDNNLIRINKKRLNYNFSVGDKVMMIEYDPTKLEAQTHGPYRIVRVFTNGAVHIELADNVQETVNIWKLFPYHGM